MGESDGLICGYILDGEGSGRSVGWDAIQGHCPEQGLLWAHLDSRHESVQAWLNEKSGLDPLTCEMLLDQETRPRSALTQDGLLLILRGVNCNPGSDPEDMVAIRMLFSANRIITMRYRRVMAVQDVQKDLDIGKGPDSTGSFLVMAAERIADRLGDVVSEIDDQVDELEDTVLTAESRELRASLAGLRRSSISLRRYIAPQRDALSRLQHERIKWLDETDRARLRETAERTARFVEDIDAARERAAITQEELDNRLSDQMNKAMYVLSIVAAIFLPLGFITGLLGVNVGGIPGTDIPWAFAFLTGALIGIAFLLVIWFKKIKWL